jgi:hypothetical protein
LGLLAAHALDQDRPSQLAELTVVGPNQDNDDPGHPNSHEQAGPCSRTGEIEESREATVHEGDADYGHQIQEKRTEQNAAAYPEQIGGAARGIATRQIRIEGAAVNV